MSLDDTGEGAVGASVGGRDALPRMEKLASIKMSALSKA